MDFPELFERQGRRMDDLLMAAFRVPPESFTAPGPAEGPSLRDLLLSWLDTQRRVVHAVLQGRPHRPLHPEEHPGVHEIARVFGGFRLTVREYTEALTDEAAAAPLEWTDAQGGTHSVSVDAVLVHLVLHDARMQGLVAERLRQLGFPAPPQDLLP